MIIAYHIRAIMLSNDNVLAASLIGECISEILFCIINE